MKRLLVLLLSFTTFALAQPSSGGEAFVSPLSSFTSFEAYFFRAFRVVDAPCPTDIFGDMCYLHDYDDVFDFKEQFNSLFSEGVTEVERWAFATAEVEGEEVEFFRATYRLPEGELFTLIFSPVYIFLER